MIDVDALVGLLREAGVTAEQTGDIVEQPFFTATGQILKTNGEDVQVFVYDTVEAAEEDAALVSADGSTVGTTMLMWVAPPRFYTTGHMIVLYVGEDASVASALEATLGGPFAGAGADATPSGDLPVFAPDQVSLASLIERLQSLDVTVEETGDVVQQPFFTPDGQVLKINGEDVQVFTYDTVDELKAEASQVMPDGFTIGTTSVMWVSPPRFYAIARFIILYLGEDPVTIGALDRVLGGPFAGANVITVEPTEQMPIPPNPSDDGTIFELQNPAILVASSEDEVAQLVRRMQDPELGDRLDSVNLEANVVVAVFRGEMRTGGYGIEIEQIQVEEGVVEIVVTLTDPGPDELLLDMVTYPVAIRIVPL